MEDFTFATFNLHHGKDKATLYSHKEMLESVASLEADVLCVQELDVSALRTYFADQPNLIAKKLGYQYVTCRVRFFGLGYQHNAIFSKKPILVADLEVDGSALRVSTAHLHTNYGRTRQNKWAQNQLMFLLDKHKDNEFCLIGGDLNLLPNEVLPIVQDYGYHAPSEYPTSPAINPKIQIDWILGKNIYLDNVHVSDLLSSDHRALIATATEVPS